MPQRTISVSIPPAKREDYLKTDETYALQAGYVVSCLYRFIRIVISVISSDDFADSIQWPR